MTLFNIALKNMRRNMKSYALYFGAVLFSIIIYFTFVTLKYSDDISALATSSQKIQSLMNAASIILFIFIALFMMYANNFFVKKRKKEIGLYALLGVRKRQIGLLLFFENIVLGVLSLIFGIGFGLLLSKLLLAILVKLMGLQTVAEFTLSMPAITNTVIVFMLIFLVTAISSMRVIYRFKLIELFQANKKGEKLPRATLMMTLFGVFSLAFGYWLALEDIETSSIWQIFSLATPLVIILATVLGTYLLFHSVLVYVFTKLKNNRTFAWRNLHVVALAQILYRIRGNATTLTAIAVLSATTVTAGGAVYSLYYNANADAHQYFPNTFMWQGAPVVLQSDDVLYDVTVQAKEMHVTVDGGTYNYNVVSNTTYSQIAELQERPKLTLQNGQAVILDQFYDERFSPNYDGVTLSVGEQQLAIQQFEKWSIFNGDIVQQVLVVSDEAYGAVEEQEKSYQLVGIAEPKEQLPLSDELLQQLGDTHLSSFPASYSQTIEDLGSHLFIGSFLGLVFLVATAAIIYFKMMTEAEEDKERYEILHKIGVNEQQMKRIVRLQIGFIFIAPLVMALMHSAFALGSFAQLMGANITLPVLIWMAIYGAIYAVIGFIAYKQFLQQINWR